MPLPTKPTSLDTVIEHPASGAGVAVVAAVGAAIAEGNSLGAVIYAAGFALAPSLYDSYASKKIQARNEAALSFVRHELENLKDEVRSLSESQFGFVSETVLTIHSAHEEEKLKYLKAAVLRAVVDGELVRQGGAQLSRILRDITAAEIIFLHENFRYKVGIALREGDSMEGVKMLDKDSEEASTLAGLASLGLISASADNPWDFSYFEWTRTAARILALIRD